MISVLFQQIEGWRGIFFTHMLKLLSRRLFSTEFYNRKTEVERLTHILRNTPPALTVLLGPPSSGKTALAKKVVEEKNDLGPMFHPLQMDLRGEDSSSPDALYRLLLRSTRSFFSEYLPTSVNVKVSSTNIVTRALEFFVCRISFQRCQKGFAHV